MVAGMCDELGLNRKKLPRWGPFIDFIAGHPAWFEVISLKNNVFNPVWLIIFAGDKLSCIVVSGPQHRRLQSESAGLNFVSILGNYFTQWFG